MREAVAFESEPDPGESIVILKLAVAARKGGRMFFVQVRVSRTNARVERVIPRWRQQRRKVGLHSEAHGHASPLKYDIKSKGRS